MGLRALKSDITLQHTATHCNTFTRVPPAASESYDTVLQHTTHCNTLHHTASHCNTLQHTATHLPECRLQRLSHAIRYYNTQHTETHCNTLQHMYPSAACSVWVMRYGTVSGTLRRAPLSKYNIKKSARCTVSLTQNLWKWLWRTCKFRALWGARPHSKGNSQKIAFCSIYYMKWLWS